MQQAILDDKFFEGLESSAAAVSDAKALPPACYTDANFYEFEKEAVFHHQWLCVGRESWVREIGSYFTTFHVGEPIIIVRTREGVLTALSSVCQHRAALVVEGHGTARSFMCPYHHWTYSLDGKLVAAPEMERTCDFKMSEVALPQLKIEVWLGFIFINFDPDAPALAPRLTRLAEVLKPYDLAAADGPTRDEVCDAPWIQKFAWNWKVQFENSNDAYHADHLHKGPIHDIMPCTLAVFPELPAGSAGYFRYNGTLTMDAGFNATHKALLPIFPKLTDEDRQRVVFANVPPTLFLFARADYVAYNIFHAEGPEEVVSERSWLVAPGAMKDPVFRDRMQMTLMSGGEVAKQDRWVDGLVQRGLRSRYATRGRYSWQEQSQSSLNHWLVRHYRNCWANGGRGVG